MAGLLYLGLCTMALALLLLKMWGVCTPSSLPAAAAVRRDTGGLAAAMWLTVGGLAGSGLALQLKLKRLDKPSERDKAAGVWYPYVLVGGALAVRDGLLQAAA